MKVYTNRFNGLWLGGTAVVVAKNAQEAATALSEHLERIHLAQVIVAEEMVEVNAKQAGVTILDNGDY